MVRRFIFILIFCLPLSLMAAKLQTERSQSFTIGDLTERTYEIREYSRKGEPAYSLKQYRNGRAIAGRALTKKTYDQIKADWKFVLPNPPKRNAASLSNCGDFVKIVKTIADGVKHESLCRESWGKSQTLRFHSFLQKIDKLSTGQHPYYEKM